jgi:hypothetical protein
MALSPGELAFGASPDMPKVDDCDMKLGQTGLGLLQSQVDWSSPGATTKAQDILRRRAYEVVTAYREGGASELGAYRACTRRKKR